MEIDISKIIKPEFGIIVQIYYNERGNAYLFETEFGYQFIYKDNRIIIDNISERFKIVGNSFSKSHVLFITLRGFYKIEILELIKTTNISLVKWVGFTFIGSLNFPFLQNNKAIIRYLQFSDKLIYFDKYIGFVYYNIITGEVEYRFEISKEIKYYGMKNYESFNLEYFRDIRISEDEKYCYIATSDKLYEVFVYKIGNFDYLLYHESCVSVIYGVFYKDFFVMPSYYVYPFFKKTFNIVNLLNREFEILDHDLLCNNYRSGYKVNNYIFVKNTLSSDYTGEMYAKEIKTEALSLDDIVYKKIITTRELTISPETYLSDYFENVFYISDNQFAVLNSNILSFHSLIIKEENDNENRKLIKGVKTNIEDREMFAIIELENSKELVTISFEKIKEKTGFEPNELELLIGSTIKEEYFKKEGQIINKNIGKDQNVEVKDYHFHLLKSPKKLRLENSDQLLPFQRIKEIFFYNSKGVDKVGLEMEEGNKFYLSVKRLELISSLYKNEFHILVGSFVSPEYYKQGEYVFNNLRLAKDSSIIKSLYLRYSASVEDMYNIHGNSQYYPYNDYEDWQKLGEWEERGMDEETDGFWRY